MTEERFAYHQGVAPLLWVFVAIASVELVVVHLLASAFAGRWVAVPLSLVSLAAIGWFVTAIRSMRARPVLVDERRLLMRVGTIRTVEIPVDQLRGIRERWDADALRDRTVLRLSLIAYPNVVLDLARPIHGRRGITAIAHRLDDPAAFAAAIERLRERG